MRLLVPLLLLAAAATWWAHEAAQREGTRHESAEHRASEADATHASAPARGAATAPALRAPGPAAPRSAADGPPERVRALVSAAGSPDEATREAALERLRALHAEEPFPLGWFVAWLLLDVPEGRVHLAAGWAEQVLGARRDETLALLAEILDEAVDAAGTTQERVGRVLLKLRGGRYGSAAVLGKDHMPQVARIFAQPGREYGLARDLVYVLDGVGPTSVPLAPVLVDYVGRVLADREVAAREAMEAGISVSWDHVEFDVERLLGAMGPAVVPVLVAWLEETYAAEGPDPDRWDAPTGIVAGALAEVGDAGIRALLGLAVDPRTRVRNDACWALAGVRKANERVRGGLLVLLRDEDPHIRSRAATALTRHGDASIPDLLRTLADPEPRVRSAASRSLSHLGVDAADALAPLLRNLEGADRGAAIAAAEALAAFGRPGLPALPTMLARMDTDDHWLRIQVGQAAARLAGLAPGMVVAAWQQASVHGRRGLIHMLVFDGVVGEDPGDGRLAALIEGALADRDLLVRVTAANAMVASARPRGLAVLREGFGAKDGAARAIATRGLARAGAAAVDLVPVIIERLRNREGLHAPGPLARGGATDEGDALDEALVALGVHDPERMAGLLGDETWSLSYAAEQSFERQGPRGLVWLAGAWDRATPVQRLAIQGVARDAFYKQSSAEGPAWVEAGRALARKGLADADPAVRLSAVEALSLDKSGGPALVLPVILELIGDESEDIRQGAAFQLHTLGKAAAPHRAQIAARAASTTDTELADALRAVLALIDEEAGK